MAVINFNLSFQASSVTTGYQDCVIIWYGAILNRNCVGTANDISDVQTWTKSCATVVNGTNNIPLSLTISDTPDNELINGCSYTIKAVVQPCCYNNIQNCNQSGSAPVIPTNLQPGTYTVSTLSIPNNMDYSACKRYIIGSYEATPSFNVLLPVTFARIGYTPCYETEYAICNNLTYTDNLVNFEPNPGNNVTYNLLKNVDTLLNSYSIGITEPHSRVIEVCSKTPPVLYQYVGAVLTPMVAGTDYTIVEMSNHGFNATVDFTNAGVCCHSCKQYKVCNSSVCEASFIIQDCNDGLLKLQTVNGQTEGNKCVISGHLVDVATGGTPCNVIFNPTTPVSGSINIFGYYDCNATPPSCNTTPPNP